MIRKSDIQWWILEAQKHPEAAPQIIEGLANRLIELDKQNEQLRNQILHMRRRKPTQNGSAQVKNLQREVKALKGLLKGELPSEPSVVFVGQQLQTARLTLYQVQEWIQQERTVLDSRALFDLHQILLVRPNDELLLLTSQGRGIKYLFADVPMLEENGQWPEANRQLLQKGERITAATTMDKLPRFWTVITRRGYTQRFVRVAFDHEVEKGNPLLKSPFRNDAPVSIVQGDRGDLLIITRWGKAVRFSQRVIETQGSVALELEPDDEVVTALALSPGAQVFLTTASGSATRFKATRVQARSRPGGKGKTIIQAHDVLRSFAHISEAKLLYLASSGKLILIQDAYVPLQERASRGKSLFNLERDPALSAIQIDKELLY